MAYEYMTMRVQADDLNEELNRMGAAGWRLANLINWGGSTALVTFERERAPRAAA